jgi:hypothetical protein
LGAFTILYLTVKGLFCAMRVVCRWRGKKKSFCLFQR